jgi:hypothetical protein
MSMLLEPSCVSTRSQVTRLRQSSVGSEEYSHFRGRFCRLRSEVNILISIEPLEQRTKLKSDLTNYRLNSSILVVRFVSFSTGQPSISGTIRGVWPWITSCNLFFRFVLFCATFQLQMSNRSEISKKSFTLTVNQFKNIF